MLLKPDQGLASVKSVVAFCIMLDTVAVVHSVVFQKNKIISGGLVLSSDSAVRAEVLGALVELAVGRSAQRTKPARFTAIALAGA